MRKVLIGLGIGLLFAAGSALAVTVSTEEIVVPARTTVEQQAVTVNSKGKTSVITYADTDVWPATTVIDTDTIPDPSTVTVTVTTSDTPPPPPPSAQCADGQDNDADGFVDLNDPGCSSVTDNDETDVPPTVADLYLSPAGSDTANCSQAFPCKTFRRAYEIAASGQTVLVGVGTYPRQDFAGSRDPNTGNNTPGGTKAVTYQGQPGTVVRGIQSSSPNLTFDGFDIDMNGAQDWCWSNGGADNVTLRNSRVGDIVDDKCLFVSGDHLTIENNQFHDVYQRTAGVHNECIFFTYVPNLVLRGNTFTSCATMDIFFQLFWSSAPTPSYGNVLIEGNTFNRSIVNDDPSSSHAYGIVIDDIEVGASKGTMNNWTVRNNWLENGIAVNPALGSGNILCGNSGGFPAEWEGSC